MGNLNKQKAIMSIKHWVCLALACLASQASAQDEETTLLPTNTPPPKVRKFRTRHDSWNRTTTSRFAAEGEEGGDGPPELVRATSTDGNHGDVATTLRRINERLAALHALDERQLTRMQSLEYKLTKMEVQNQEKLEGLRSELREVNRRVQQVDWVVNKMEATIEGIKMDVAGLRQGQEMIRGLQTFNANLNDEEKETKLQGITSSIHWMKGSLMAIHKEVNIISHNMTLLNNVTRTMSSLRGQLLTKQHFTMGLLDLKEESKQRTLTLNAVCPATPAPNEERPPQNCWEAQKSGFSRSGMYWVQPTGARQPFFVFCQMEAMGGGWTVVQNRNEGSVDFFRGWQDYKHGFGNLAGEFWLGLQKMHLLTGHKVHELLIELQDFELENVTAYYASFGVGPETEGYPISFIGSYEGTAGDCLSYHAGNKFSTFDLDNDAWVDGNCAESHTGGWWYKGCDTANLNGKYLNGEVPAEYEYKGMYWYDWRGPSYSLKATRMSIRPYQGKMIKAKLKGKTPKNAEENVVKENVVKEVHQPSTRHHLNYTNSNADEN